MCGWLEPVTVIEAARTRQHLRAGGSLAVLPRGRRLPGGASARHHRPRMENVWQRREIIAHSACLARSFRRFTGRELLPGLFNPAGLARNLFDAPFVLVSHGTEADPVLNYGNAAALRLWEMSWEELTRTPSRLTAEAPERGERERLLAAVTANGFIDDYSGVRISRTGRRFRISRATVWNLVTEKGEPCGQAAVFAHWEHL